MNFVASFAEAWIEIPTQSMTFCRIVRSPPSRRRGLKYQHEEPWQLCRMVASFAEAWIEISRWCFKLRYSCRLLRGGVDWNHQSDCVMFWDEVASFAEAWIEISSCLRTSGAGVVASFAEAWIEIAIALITFTVTRRLLRGGVDWNNNSIFRVSALWVASFAEAWIEMM